MDQEKTDELKGKIDLNTENKQANIVVNNPNNNEANPGNSGEQKLESIEWDTLDESVAETIKRDLLKIKHKIKHVLFPKSKAEEQEELRNCIISVKKRGFMGTIPFIVLSIGSSDQTGSIFVVVFFIVWVGGVIVTLNAQFLGANISILQSICILGYCVFPIDIAAILIKVFSFLPALIKIVVAIGAFLWATGSSIGFLSQIIEEKKKILATYPIMLFYLFLSWFVLAQN